MNTTGKRLSDSCHEKSGHIVAGWLCPGTKAAHLPSDMLSLAVAGTNTGLAARR